jgi:hypothetical protein
MTDDGMLRATTRTGLSLTQTGGDQPKKRSPAPYFAVAGVVILGLAGGLGVALTRHSPAPAASAAPQIVMLKSEPATNQIQDPVIKSFELAFEPAEAEIQVDGKPVTAVGGRVTLSGPPGSTHDVHLVLDGVDKTQTVAITATGLIPPRLALDMPKKGQPIAARRGPAAAKGSQPAAAPGEAPKAATPPKKADIAKDTSEFQ